MRIKIAEDFTPMPGGRLSSEGEYSGEEFRETILRPKYEDAKHNNESLIIDLDGGYGYPTSFLEEAFGGLARSLKDDGLLALEFVSDDEPALIEKIREYIKQGLRWENKK